MTFKEEIAKDIDSQYNVHDDLKGLPVNALREICKTDELPFAVCAISVTGDLNIGTIIRTSSLFGAEKVIVVGRKRFDRRGLVGSLNYIDVEFVPCLDNNTLEIDEQSFVDKMKESNYIPIFVEQGGVTLNKVNWNVVSQYATSTNKKICIVVGNENRGIPNNILETKKEFEGSMTVSISQKGVIRSHNVSVATGIVLGNMTQVLYG